MKAVLAGYQAISILRGGPRTQLCKTAEHLPSCGVEASLFDPWAPFGRSSCDLVHIFAANIGTYHLAREIKVLGLPMVVSPIVFSSHGSAFVRNALRMSRTAERVGPGIWSDYGLTADICGWARRVMPNTASEADLLIEGYGVPRSKVTVVPNGVDAKFASGNPDLFVKTYGVRDFILNVGHIGHRRKNVLALIRALAAIDHPAVIVGRIIRNAEGDECVREAEKHRHILLIDGLEPDSDMLASAYAACNVFALPSLFETPGIAALEAGLAGAKVVITEHGGTREYFGEMARYVDPGSVEAIRTGIQDALNHAKSPELQQHIREHFLWERVAEKTADVYREVMAGEKT